MGFLASHILIICWNNVPLPYGSSTPFCIPAVENGWHGNPPMKISKSGTSSGFNFVISPKFFIFFPFLSLWFKSYSSHAYLSISEYPIISNSKFGYFSFNLSKAKCPPPYPANPSNTLNTFLFFIILLPVLWHYDINLKYTLYLFLLSLCHYLLINYITNWYIVIFS